MARSSVALADWVSFGDRFLGRAARSFVTCGEDLNTGRLHEFMPRVCPRFQIFADAADIRYVTIVTTEIVDDREILDLIEQENPRWQPDPGFKFVRHFVLGRQGASRSLVAEKCRLVRGDVYALFSEYKRSEEKKLIANTFVVTGFRVRAELPDVITALRAVGVVWRVDLLPDGSPKVIFERARSFKRDSRSLPPLRGMLGPPRRCGRRPTLFVRRPDRRLWIASDGGLRPPLRTMPRARPQCRRRPPLQGRRTSLGSPWLMAARSSLRASRWTAATA
jgi:hypothetical protein